MTEGYFASRLRHPADTKADERRGYTRDCGKHIGEICRKLLHMYPRPPAGEERVDIVAELRAIEKRIERMLETYEDDDASGG